MMFQVGDGGVVSTVDEDNLIYVDKNELDELIDRYNRLEDENEQLKQKIKSINEILSKDMGYVESFEKIEEVLK